MTLVCICIFSKAVPVQVKNLKCQIDDVCVSSFAYLVKRKCFIHLKQNLAVNTTEFDTNFIEYLERFCMIYLSIFKMLRKFEWEHIFFLSASHDPLRFKANPDSLESKACRLWPILLLLLQLFCIQPSWLGTDHYRNNYID